VSHHPGPWWFEEDGERPWSHTIYAPPYDIEEGELQVATYVNEDDASLIAAAPELLEALKIMLYQYGTYTTGGIGDEPITVHARDDKPWLERARTAIAKAEGESMSAARNPER
jgi:hypothetical protein